MAALVVALSELAVRRCNRLNMKYYVNFSFITSKSTEYYPFGMPMPNRTYSLSNGSKYRFGFNGQEKDDEVKGDGNSLEYKFRMYDPRLGKFLSVDPLATQYPFYSPYHFAGNNPIQYVDLEGKEPKDFRNNWIDLTDPVVSRNGMATIRTIYDQVSDQVYSVMQPLNSNRFYYLTQKGSDGNSVPNAPILWGSGTYSEMAKI